MTAKEIMAGRARPIMCMFFCLRFVYFRFSNSFRRNWGEKDRLGPSYQQLYLSMDAENLVMYKRPPPLLRQRLRRYCDPLRRM